MASNSKEPGILLSDWIRRALDAVNQSAHPTATTAATICNSMALCSDEYLMPALRLAYSLVDQLCKQEAIGKSPTLSVDWVDNVVVYSNNRVGRGLMHGGGLRDSLDSQDFIDSVGFNFDPIDVGGNDFDADGLFGSILNDDAILSGEKRERDVQEEGCDDIRAELSPSLFNLNMNVADDGGLAKDFSTQRIHSLGIVFYVLFSGGERPAHNRSGTETEEFSQDQELSEDLKPLPFHQAAPPIDLVVGLSMFDRIVDEYVNVAQGNRTFDDAPQNLNPKKKHASQQNKHICNNCLVSAESLREKGLPSPLCDLVVNMLDCKNGTLSGEDSYQSMSDVRSDLRLMLDNPNTFFRDVDTTKLSTTGIKLIGKTMFGRNEELSSIKDAYRRSISIPGKCGLVTITGTSGTGKSLLANEFGKFVASDGGIFLSGKFDQLQQGKPFSALASTFDQYCGMLLQYDDAASPKEEVAFQLRSVLGKESYHLSKIIPNLAAILGSELPLLNLNEDCINAQKRVQYLLCQFVEVISSSSSVPITLFLDDLQWADAASIAVVNQLLFATGLLSHKNFFFLGCARERDSATKWLPGVDTIVAGGVNIRLDCMDEHTLNAMVSETLHLLPRLTRTLSNVIYHKTKGNPLFVSRLMRSLSNEGLLRPSLSRRRWEWDTKDILARRLPDDVAIFLTDSFRELPEEVQWALFVLSCFGASSEKNAFVERQGLDSNVLKNLEIAVAEGLVDKIDDQYRFAHDRIQEAAYNSIPAHKRSVIHFEYGIEISSLLSGEEDASASVLFTAVNQLNLGGPHAVQDKSQYITAARLNLKAGKKAMEMSDYETAHLYFDCGISFLRKKHWEEHYSLSLELFSLAARCSLTNGDHTSMKILIAEVMAKAQSFEDKLDVLYFETCALASSSRLADSIEQGLDILSKLGIKVDGANVEACVQETKDILSAYTDDELLNSKQMTDPTMIMVMKFLGKLEFGMTLIMPKSVPFVASKIIQLSLAYGMSPVSPIGFTYYGSYLAKQWNINEGYYFVKLALSLLDKVGSRENAGEVILICTQVKLYVEPLQAALEYHHEGYTAAMVSGDSSLAVINLFSYDTSNFYAGTNLQKMHKMYTSSIQFSEQRKQLIFMVQSQLVQRTVSKLIGTVKEPKYSPERQDILASNCSVVRSHHYQKAYVSFIFRSYDDTVENIEKFIALQDTTWGNLFIAHAVHCFYTGLISFWVARKSKEQKWARRGNYSKSALRKWADSSQWTFQNKWYLLEAEESFCSNDFETAKAYYKKAVTSAKQHKVR